MNAPGLYSLIRRWIAHASVKGFSNRVDMGRMLIEARQ